MSISLELFFIRDNSIFVSFILFDNKYNIPETTIKFNINNKYFKYKKDFFTTSITLIGKPNIITEQFNIYYGENYAYCFLDSDQGITYELIYKDINVKIQLS